MIALALAAAAIAFIIGFVLHEGNGIVNPPAFILALAWPCVLAAISPWAMLAWPVSFILSGMAITKAGNYHRRTRR